MSALVRSSEAKADIARVAAALLLLALATQQIEGEHAFRQTV
jgi:hypothetical protein